MERILVYIAIVATALGMLLAVFIIMAYTLPFHPMRIYDIDVLSDETCPGNKVEVILDREVDSRWKIEEVEIDPTWIHSSGGQGRLLEESDVELRDIQPHERKYVQSPIAFYAPREPGTWYLEEEVTVRGKVFYIPRSTTFIVRDVTPTTVKDCAG